MIIKRLELNKIMSHDHTVVDFDRGVNAIVGPNGSGKSAMIDSIVYALIGGCVRGEEAVRAELSSIVRVGSRRASIIVDFEIGGRCYRVERVISVGEDSQSLFILRECSGQLIAQGREAFCDKMKELLGLKDLKALPHTLIARQGHLSDFIMSEPSKRAEMILDLLGLAWLDKAKETLGKAMRGLEIEVASLSRDEERLRYLETEVARLRERINQLKEEEEKLIAGVKEAEALEKTLKKELEEIRGLWMTIDKLRTYEQLKRDMENVEREIANLQSKLEKLAPFKEAEQILYEGLGFIKLIESDSRRIRDEIRRLEERLSKTTGGKQLEELEKELEEYRRLEDELSQRYKELTAEEKIIMTALQAGISGDRCPLCGSPLDEDKKQHMIEIHAKRLLELKEEIPRAKERMREASAKRVSLEDAVKTARESLREIEKLKQKLEENNRRVNNYLEKYNSVVEKLGLPRAESFDDCRFDDIARVLEEIRRLEMELERKKGSLESLKRRISEYHTEEFEKALEAMSRKGLTIDTLEKTYKELYKKYEEAIVEVEARKAELSEKRGELSALKSQLSSRERELRDLKEVLKDLDAKKRALAIAERLHGEYLGKSGFLSRKALESFRERFASTVNDILSRLGRDFSVELTEDMDLEIERDGQTLSLNSLSGGERTLLAIISRIALAQMMSGKRVSVLILDEPTEYLDSEARKTVFQVIREVAEYIDQIIVVTHDPEVEDIADLLIHVEKRGGVSRVAVERITSSSGSQG